MNEIWKSVFKTTLFFFVFWSALELLRDYLKTGETTFASLKSLKFYVVRIAESLIWAISFEFLFLKFSKKLKRQ